MYWILISFFIFVLIVCMTYSKKHERFTIDEMDQVVDQMRFYQSNSPSARYKVHNLLFDQEFHQQFQK